MQLSILAKIIDLLFPRFCPVCGKRLVGGEESICASCNLHLPRTNTWEAPYENEIAKMFWHRIPIEKAGALLYYEGHSFTSNIIYQLKYGHRPDIAFDMGRLLAQEGMKANFFDDIDGIVPIPLAKNRQRERGYNQSEEIAKGIADITHLPVLSHIVRRTTFKESQTNKNRWERQQNVKTVFELYPDYLEENTPNKNSQTSLEGKHYLIVDDVCTTGSTICSCCDTMLQAGNMRFSILTIGYAKK